MDIIIDTVWGQLPPASAAGTLAELLTVGTVIGRDVELGLLTTASGLESDAFFDALEPNRLAGAKVSWN